MNRCLGTTVAFLLFLSLTACRSGPSEGVAVVSVTTAGGQGNSAPSQHTRDRNARVAEQLDLGDPADFESARRGLLAREDEVIVRDASGKTIWDTTSYAFETGESPDSVNPSLWRQAKLNNEHGLFEVTEGIYQVRGYDLANMSIIVGDEGWIIVDPLTSFETATAALALAAEALADRSATAEAAEHVRSESRPAQASCRPGAR